MKSLSFIGMTTTAAVLAVSGVASAATTAYVQNGYIVASDPTCTSFGLAVGNAVTSVINYPGPSKPNMSLVSPGTAATATGTGKTLTHVCIAGKGTTGPGAVGKQLTPAAGLDGATIPFTCFGDNQAGPAATLEATASIKFTVKPTSDPNLMSATAETVETLTIPGVATCTYTTDGTWTAE